MTNVLLLVIVMGDVGRGGVFSVTVTVVIMTLHLFIINIIKVLSILRLLILMIIITTSFITITVFLPSPTAPDDAIEICISFLSESIRKKHFTSAVLSVEHDDRPHLTPGLLNLGVHHVEDRVEEAQLTGST
jgi:hypothetical protein